MIVLPQEQIDVMVQAMDYILKSKQTSVAEIREHFHLSVEEYSMIFDLCMPVIRKGSRTEYWKNKYVALKQAICDRIRKEPIPMSKLGIDIYEIAEDSKIGEHNQLAQEELKEEGEIG